MQEDQLYQHYCQTEKKRNLNLMSFNEPPDQLRYSDKCYQECNNNSGYINIDTGRVFPISFASPSRSHSRSYIKLDENEATPLLGGSQNFTKVWFTNRSRIWLSVYVIFYVGFLSIGGVMFQTVELSAELRERQHFRDVRQGFLVKHPSVLGRFLFFIYFFIDNLPKKLFC